MKSNIEWMQGIKSLNDIEVKDQRVLIRVDFNMPLDSDLSASSDHRIKSTLHTIHHCIDHEAKQIILVSHLGTVDGVRDLNFSLRPIQKRLEHWLNHKVTFIDDFIADKSLIDDVPKGGVVLLENIRFYKEEKLNGIEFSKALASLCDIYVNDAFGVSHRLHASIYGITRYVPQKVAGFLLLKELHTFINLMNNAINPVTLVIGGAKISTKTPLLHAIIQKVDKMIIGGAISNTFLKAMGHDMKDSLLENDYLDMALSILKEAALHKVKVYLPVDVVVTDSAKAPNSSKITTVQDIPDHSAVVDIGPASVKLFSLAIESSNTIFWNGPMGMYESAMFSNGTSKIAEAIADSYAYSIVGGGDTAKAIEDGWNREDFSFISSGGGASLELLEGKILSGLQHLNRRKVK